MENLVIVESPSKAKTIGKYLGSKFHVEACMGHLRDLPKSKLGVDIEKDFEPGYITVRGKAKLVNSLKKLAKSAKKVYLATDPDREGEAISWHLTYLLGLEKDKFARVAFNEITKTAVKEAIANAREIDQDLVDAQQARRVLDRLVGYQISPLLWKKVKKGLSAGRVQSAATEMIVQRQREIDAFVPTEYWSITAELEKKKKFNAIHPTKKMSVEDKKQADDIVKQVEKAKFIVTNVKKSEKKRSPAPPFTTSTMQQEASRKLNFQSRRTMQVAQGLYEGVSIQGRGHMGLITYMRTDSLRISEEALAAVREYITGSIGKEYVPEAPRFYKTKKNVQDAHEAIRPTDVTLTPADLKPILEASQWKLYKLIWERFVASQMENAILDTVSVDIEANKIPFRASGSTIKFHGFMKLYIEGTDSDEEEKEGILPELAVGDELKLISLKPEQHFTAPPPYYTEASLIKAMEEEGIGRPSTYAPTIATITARGYVGREAKQLFPTELGKIVTDLMENYFDDIVDLKFTASIESQLDEVAGGAFPWKKVMHDFYPSFKVKLDKAESEIEKIKIEDEVSDVICEKCGRNLVYKLGKYGKFLACPGFPDCRNIKSIIETIEEPCPKCGGTVVIKKMKKGGRKFFVCEHNEGENKGTCDYISWKKPGKDGKEEEKEPKAKKK